MEGTLERWQSEKTAATRMLLIGSAVAAATYFIGSLFNVSAV